MRDSMLAMVDSMREVMRDPDDQGDQTKVIEELREDVSALDARFSHMEEQVLQVDSKMKEVDGKMDTMMELLRGLAKEKVDE